MTLPDSDSFQDLGGEKEDYDSIVNSLTDRSAAEVNPAFCDIAEMTRTSSRAWVRFATSATTPVLQNWDSHWKGATATDPVIARSSTGTFTITFPVEVNDELEESHLINLHSCQATFEGTTFGFVNAEVSNSNVITVICGNAAGSASDLAGIVVNVWVI